MDSISSKADIKAKGIEIPFMDHATEVAWSEFSRMPAEILKRKLAKMPQKGYIKVRLNASTVHLLENESNKSEGWQEFTKRGRGEYFPLYRRYRNQDQPTVLRDISESSEPETRNGKKILDDFVSHIISVLENRPYKANTRHFDIKIGTKDHEYHRDTFLSKVVANYTFGNASTTKYLSKDVAKKHYKIVEGLKNNNENITIKNFKKGCMYLFLAFGIKSKDSYILVHAGPDYDPERMLFNARWS